MCDNDGLVLERPSFAPVNDSALGRREWTVPAWWDDFWLWFQVGIIDAVSSCFPSDTWIFTAILYKAFDWIQVWRQSW